MKTSELIRKAVAELPEEDQKKFAEREASIRAILAIDNWGPLALALVGAEASEEEE
jgi:hypothetical protein